MPQTALKGRCNAKVANLDELCDNYPVNGSQRCHLHGAYSTGARTAEGKARNSMNGIKNGLYINTLAGYIEKMGIPKDLWESIPDSVDLSPEIRVIRGNVVRFAQLLSRGIKFISSSEDGSVQEMRDMDDGRNEATTQHKSFPMVLSVDTLYAQALDQLRRMVKTQHEIKPSADVGGNFHFKITVSGDAKKASEAEGRVPKLTDDDAIPEEPTTVRTVEDVVKPKSKGGYDDED